MTAGSEIVVISKEELAALIADALIFLASVAFAKADEIAARVVDALPTSEPVGWCREDPGERWAARHFAAVENGLPDPHRPWYAVYRKPGDAT